MFAIALDGPSGAGKSTIAKLLSKKLGIAYLDTGAMYRCVGLFMLEHGVDVADSEGVARLIDEVQISFVNENGVQKIMLNGRDVTSAIREHRVSAAASTVSAHGFVREKLVDMQRKIAAASPSVLDGRDIGSVVLPDADYKFYLTASVEARAKRRYDELIEKGQSVVLADIARDIAQRDHNDMTRAHSPLVIAEGAIVIDSTDMNIDEVLEKITSYVEARV